MNDDSIMVYLIKLYLKDKDTKEDKSKNHMVCDKLFNTVEELDMYLHKVAEEDNSILISYKIRLNYSTEYREMLQDNKAEKQTADLVTIDRNKIRDAIKDIKIKHNGWHLSKESNCQNDIMYYMFNLIGIKGDDCI